MAKQPEEDHLDTLRHQELVEQEERMYREYPLLKRENEELKLKLADLERYKRSWDKELVDARAAAKYALESERHLAEQNIKLREEIRVLRSQPQEQARKPFEFKKGKCRECGEEILWGKTKIGKFIPLDPDPVTGEVIAWTKELQLELEAKGIETRQGYDEMGERTTVAIVTNGDPTLMKKIYPVHFTTCGR